MQGSCLGCVKFSRWLHVQRIEAILVLQTVNIQQLIKSCHVFNIPSLTLCNSRGRAQMFAFPYSISSLVPLAALRAEEPKSHCLRDAPLEGCRWLEGRARGGSGLWRVGVCRVSSSRLPGQLRLRSAASASRSDLLQLPPGTVPPRCCAMCA